MVGYLTKITENLCINSQIYKVMFTIFFYMHYQNIIKIKTHPTVVEHINKLFKNLEIIN